MGQSNIITTKGTKSHEGNGLQMPFVILRALSGSRFKIRLTHYRHLGDIDFDRRGRN